MQGVQKREDNTITKIGRQNLFIKNFGLQILSTIREKINPTTKKIIAITGIAKIVINQKTGIQLLPLKGIPSRKQRSSPITEIIRAIIGKIINAECLISILLLLSIILL